MLPARCTSSALGSKNTTWPRSSRGATLRLSVCHSLAMMATRLVVRNSCGMRWRRRAGVLVCQLSHLKRSLCVRHLSKANRPSRELAAPSASTTCRASQHLHSDEHRIPLSQVVNPRVGALRPLPRGLGPTRGPKLWPPNASPGRAIVSLPGRRKHFMQKPLERTRLFDALRNTSAYLRVVNSSGASWKN